MYARLVYALVAGVLSVGLLAGADVSPIAGPFPKAKSGFVFPQVNPKTIPPSPAPLPGAVPMLTGETLYVIPSDEPFLLFDSPKGLVTVTREAGPLRIRGKFLDGSGRVETRNYAAKHLAIIEAAPGAKGRVELIAVPQGITDEASAARMLVDVNQGPQPPPPGPTPDPEPKPPTPVVTSFRVIWVVESGDNAKVAVADAKAVRDYLNENTSKEAQWPGWRRFDPQQEAANETPIMKELWLAVKPKLTTTPCVVVEINGKASIEPYPASATAALALFRKFKEGK